MTGYGTVYSNKLPDFDYFEINENRYNHCEDWTDHLWFSSEERIYDNSDEVYATIQTSDGKLTGYVKLPDEISSLSFNNEKINFTGSSKYYGSLNVNDSLVFSWEGGESDFYRLELSYTWKDSSGVTTCIDLDTTVIGNRIEMPELATSYPGETVVFKRIYPTNGPLPGDLNGNMSGDGTGNLYYINKISSVWFCYFSVTE